MQERAERREESSTLIDTEAPHHSLTHRSSMEDVPIIDVAKFLNKEEGWETECDKVAECLHKYGILIFKDPRAKE